MGIAYAVQNNYPEAMRCYQKAIEIDPNLAAAYNNMGIIYGKQGDETNGIEYTQKAARLGDENAQETLRNIGYDW
jgi:tetratricopeptide (TPR) repeat protein